MLSLDKDSIFKNPENELEEQPKAADEAVLEENAITEIEAADDCADAAETSTAVEEAAGEDSQEAVQEKEEKGKKKKKTKKKRKRLNPWISLLIKIAVIALIIFIGSFFVQFKAVHDNDMFPALRDGDLVITTNLLSPSFNDIVLYKITTPSGAEERHLGRVISLGGNEVSIDDYGNVMINGSIISSSDFYEGYGTGDFEFPYQIEENDIYILQDYRVEMNDSRIFGGIPSEDIIGKVIFVFRIRGF